MRVKILGSAAGGGFPQWNCACRNCTGLREGKLRGRARTQTQIAINANPEYALRNYWSLVGASPDLRSQILATPELWPFANTNGSTAVREIYLPSADVDSLMGLLHLREFQSFKIFAMPSVRRILSEENSMFRVLGRATPPVQWFSLGIARSAGPTSARDSGTPPQFICQAVPLGGEYPEYISKDLRTSLPPEEAVVAFAFEYSGKRVLFAPALPGRNPDWKKWAEASDLVLIDGTFWSDRELPQTGRSQKTARQMGHLPIFGPDGLLEQYPRQAKGRKVLIHINNTNPVLDEDSAEHRAVLDAGFEIAYDGMEFAL